MIKKQSNDRFMAFFSSEKQSCRSALCRIDVSIPIKKQFNDRFMAFLRCNVQRCPVVAIDGID